MRVGLALMAILLALLGKCSLDVFGAEHEFEIVSEHGGSDAEKCLAAAKAAKTWRRYWNTGKYEEWQLQRDIYCLAAGVTPADAERYSN
jgi:hypothetical protein